MERAPVEAASGAADPLAAALSIAARYAGLAGSIEHVSADSIRPQHGEPYYLAHVRTASATLPYRERALRER